MLWLKPNTVLPLQTPLPAPCGKTLWRKIVPSKDQAYWPGVIKMTCQNSKVSSNKIMYLFTNLLPYRELLLTALHINLGQVFWHWIKERGSQGLLCKKHTSYNNTNTFLSSYLFVLKIVLALYWHSLLLEQSPWISSILLCSTILKSWSFEVFM